MKTRLLRSLYLLLIIATLCVAQKPSHAQGVYRFLGMTNKGGQHNTGVLFTTDSNATNYQVKFDFLLSNAGAAPQYTRLTLCNQKYYGLTIAGGSNNSYGVIFEWDPITNQYIDKYSFAFEDAWFAYGSLTVLNNKLYGMTSRGGDYGLGVIFEWNPSTNEFQKIYHFGEESGHSPEGTLTAYQGKLYGMTRSGGDNFAGTLFTFDPQDNSFTKNHDFDYSTGKSPRGELLMYDGLFYGLTAEGGNNGYGVLFEWNPATNSYTKRIDFDGNNGAYPYGALTIFQDKLFGLTSEGGANNAGVLFEYQPQASSCIKKLDFGGNLGSTPYGSLCAGENGLAGMTWMGGDQNSGVLFEYNPNSNTVNTSFEFGNVFNGCNPMGSLVWDGENYLGLTSGGGASNGGVIFKWNAASNQYTKKLDLNVASNGRLPKGNLIKHGSKLYGTTSAGGASDKGVLFSYDEDTKTFSRLYDFDGASGALPTGDLMIIDGKLIGWTYQGGTHGRGSIFEWNITSQTMQLVYSFNGPTGTYPSSGPLFWNGKIYGTTTEGGVNGQGVLYELNPSDYSYQKKYDFSAETGSYPTGYLKVRDNKIYGTATFGGVNETGVIYEWDPANNNYTARYHFEVTGMGVHPRTGLVLSEDSSVFYGMTRETNGNIAFPGQEGAGVIFEWNPATGVYSKKIDFDGDNGGVGIGGLSYSNGKYYGMTTLGGDGESYPGINIIVGGSGVIFEWDPQTNIISKKVDLLGDNGAYPSSNDLVRTKVAVAGTNAPACYNLPVIDINATNNNKWVPITDVDGNVIAEINANGNNLGLVQTSLSMHQGAIREDNKRRLYLDRSITIVPAVQPTSDVMLRLYIREGEFEKLKQSTNSLGQPSGITQAGELAVYKMDTDCGETITELNNRQLTSTLNWSNDFVYAVSVSSFSTFYFASSFGNESTLPVTFLDVTATLEKQHVEVKWETTYERDILRYDVERSADGINFTSIGQVAARNAADLQKYSFSDQSVLQEAWSKVYYRIRETDLDGDMVYSKEVMVSLPVQKLDVQVYPNPVQSASQIKVTSAASGQWQLRIVDVQGKQIRSGILQAQAGTSYFPLQLDAVPAGIYFLELKSGNTRQQVKLLKQ